MKPSITWAEKFIKKCGGFLFWIAVWHFTAAKIGKEVLMASPATTAKALIFLLGESAFWRVILFSVSRILVGFFARVIFGVILAAASAASQMLQALIKPIVSMAKTVPVASFIILALLWVSGKNLSICISFFMVMPIIYTNMLEGFENVDKKLLEMAQVFRFSAKKKFLYIYLPQLLPYFTAACTTSLGLCWKSGIAAEIIGLPSGSIGNRLYQTKLYLDTPQMFAWTAVIVIISIAAEKGFNLLLNTLNKKIQKGFL